MTGTQSGSPDSALDQPMMIIDEDAYPPPPPERAHAPPIPPMVRMEVRGTGPLEEGDAIVGGARKPRWSSVRFNYPPSRRL